MFKKFNKVAVLICGELRQYWRAAPSQFEFFSHFSDQVDYFLVTWDTSKDLHLTQLPRHLRDHNHYDPVSESQVCDVYKDINLKEFRTVSREEFYQSPQTKELISSGIMSNFFCRAHLAQLAGDLKRYHEKLSGEEYSLVAEIRPDLWIRSDHFYDPILLIPMVPLSDWQIYAPTPWRTKKIYPRGCVDVPEQVPAMDDLYFMSNSRVSDVLSDRANFRKKVNPHNDHKLIYDHLESRGIFIVRDVFGTSTDVVRPNVPEDFDFNGTGRNTHEISNQLRKYNDIWCDRVSK